MWSDRVSTRAEAPPPLKKNDKTLFRGNVRGEFNDHSGCLTIAHPRAVACLGSASRDWPPRRSGRRRAGPGRTQLGCDQTYYPTSLRTALRQKLFEKEGIKAELTVYRGGAEGYEAMARAPRMIMNSASSVAAGIKKGVLAKNLAGTALGYYGWHLVVKAIPRSRMSANSPARKSASRRPVRAPTFWRCGPRPTARSSSPACRLAAAGWCETCSSGNIDATVLYSPLTYRCSSTSSTQLIDFRHAVPSHLTGAWMSTDKFIKG